MFGYAKQFFSAGVLGDLDPPRIGPPSADLDPLTNSVKTLPYIIFLHNFVVESDNNPESKFLEKFFRKYVFKVGTF